MSVPPEPTSALILHGYANHRPPGHWQRLLADDLRSAGVDVRYPQLPDPDAPDWARWRGAVADEVATLSGRCPVVIAHSLAAWVLLDLLGDADLLGGTRILLAAPAARSVVSGIAPIAAFDRGHDDATLAAVVTRHGGTEVVCSDDDPYWPGGAADWARHLGATVHPLTGQGHLALDDGYGRWSSVGDWVHRGGSITARESRLGGGRPPG